MAGWLLLPGVFCLIILCKATGRCTLLVGNLTLTVSKAGLWGHLPLHLLPIKPARSSMLLQDRAAESSVASA
ncbi:hypothetical protein BDW66DRAFT_132959 [Aspergillus desertorum]